MPRRHYGHKMPCPCERAPHTLRNVQQITEMIMSGHEDGTDDRIIPELMNHRCPNCHMFFISLMLWDFRTVVRGLEAIHPEIGPSIDHLLEHMMERYDKILEQDG